MPDRVGHVPGESAKHLRAAIGHSNHGTLQRYVPLAPECDLGPRADWLELIANNPATEWSWQDVWHQAQLLILELDSGMVAGPGQIEVPATGPGHVDN